MWKSELIYRTEHMPQFREADPDGLIGLRGYINYFQDAGTQYMHYLHLGNDTLPEEYGICWLYSKYRLHICRKADFTAGLEFQTWVEKAKPSIRLHQDIIISRGTEVFAFGRLEECLLRIKDKKLCRISDIDYPFETASEKQLELPPFLRIKPVLPEGARVCYAHTVRYTDLDKSGHMNNLLYVNLVLNAFDYSFLQAHFITDFEIHYLNQCYEGNILHIYQRLEGDAKGEVWGVKIDGTPVVYSQFEFAIRNQ